MTQVYVMQAADGPVKIGVSRNPERRAFEVDRWHRWGVEGQIAVRHRVEVPEGLKARRIEYAAHLLADAARLDGEWFDLSPAEALATIQRAIELRGDVHRMAPQRTIISMPPELKERISAFRHAERIGSEAEAIRQLITEALDARSGSTKGEK